METLLVIGAESTVGANVACTLADTFHVVGLSRAGQLDLDGCRTVACEFSVAEIGRWIDELSPNWIVFSGATARSSWDEADIPPEWLAVESELAGAVAAAARRACSRLTYVSTDGVFAGPQMFHAEASAAHAHGPLAETALAAEAAVMTAGEAEAGPAAALVVRTHAYGWSPTAHAPDFAERFWQSLDTGMSVHADAHRHATPILASDLASLLHAAYRANLRGLLHIGGAERTNPRRFAHELASALGIQSRPGIALETAWERVKETSLISRRAQQALDQPLPMLREGLRRFVAQLDNGYRDRLRSEEAALAPAKAA